MSLLLEGKLLITNHNIINRRLVDICWPLIKTVSVILEVNESLLSRATSLTFSQRDKSEFVLKDLFAENRGLYLYILKPLVRSAKIIKSGLDYRFSSNDFILVVEPLASIPITYWFALQ